MAGDLRRHVEPGREPGQPDRLSPIGSRRRGAGLLSTLFGFLFFLVFLLLAVHVMLHLYTSSAVSGAAYDAAVSVAGFESRDARSTGEAEAAMRAALGSFGSEVDVAWVVTADEVQVRVTGQAPSTMPARWASSIGLTIDKTVTVRVEDFREPVP